MANEQQTTSRPKRSQPGRWPAEGGRRRGPGPGKAGEGARGRGRPAKGPGAGAGRRRGPGPAALSRPQRSAGIARGTGLRAALQREKQPRREKGQTASPAIWGRNNPIWVE